MAETVEQQKSTAAMVQWQQIKDQHPEKVLFFQIGDFYEVFNEDARICANILGLTLTSRSKSADATPMAGVPIHAADRYIRQLIDAGIKIAICDQLETPEEAKTRGALKRGVVQVVTPGTVVDDYCLQPKHASYLTALQLFPQYTALAWADVAAGDLRCLLLPESANILDEIDSINPVELLLPKDADNADSCLNTLIKLNNNQPLNYAISERDSQDFSLNNGRQIILEHFGVSNLDGYQLEDTPELWGVCAALLLYIKETLPNGTPRFPTLKRNYRNNYLQLDRATRQHLELTSTRSDNGTSLLSIIDATKTAGGARKLKEWLLNPLADIDAITARSRVVSYFLDNFQERQELQGYLQKTSDLARIASRITAGRASPRDLAALGLTLQQLPPILKLLSQANITPLGWENSPNTGDLLPQIISQLNSMAQITEFLEHALADTPALNPSQGKCIADGYNQDLDELRELITGGRNWIAELQAKESQLTGIPSLKIGYNRVFGYYIEITNTHKDSVPERYVRKQTLSNAERYITPELKSQEAKVLGAEERALRLESELLKNIQKKLVAYNNQMHNNANALAELDAISSMAEVAERRKYIPATVHTDLATEIIDGRHPVVEISGVADVFVQNDTVFVPDNSRLHIITGPNMSGKSTYIRQVAILTIMAHIGMPVPAEVATIGLCDRVFTRIGAGDDLSRGRSTFMVEMAECAAILNTATERSLVILDEIGRGTSTFDGVSLAWSITEYLHNIVKCRTLFATHYHELAELGDILPWAKNFNVAVREWQGSIVFLHKIISGACDRSYGLHVAMLAGLPRQVIDRAREVLLGLENQAEERDVNYSQKGDALRAAARMVQMDLFADGPIGDPDAVIRTIHQTTVADLTPEQALKLVTELKTMAGDAVYYTGHKKNRRKKN